MENRPPITQGTERDGRQNIEKSVSRPAVSSSYKYLYDWRTAGIYKEIHYNKEIENVRPRGVGIS